MLIFLISLLTIVVVAYAISTSVKSRNYPPGPIWYPFVGCRNKLNSAIKKHGSQFKALLELSKEYSTQVLGLKLGGERVVVVFGKEKVKQALIHKAFEGRPDNFFLRLRCLGKRLGITFTDGSLWNIHRQFTLKQMKAIGFGKKPMEKEIQKELQSIVIFLNKNCHQSISPNNFVSQAVMNVLWKFVAGEKINEDRWKYIHDLFKMRSKAFSMAGGLLNEIPWCRFFIPNLSGYTLITKLNGQISDIIEETINKHKKNETDGKDFIYAFMQEMADNRESFTEDQLKVVCLDLIIAGSQTTASLLEFAFVELLRNKEIQEKVYDEIEHVLGDDIPSLTDQPRLTYTSAFLLEVHRYHPIAPLVGPRRVLYNTVIDGYIIPKNTTVLMSLGDINFDPELWQDPHTFNPERFIDQRGMLQNSENLYPFGLGRRRCPGDALVNAFIFITLVGILQRFKVDCSNDNVPSKEPFIGLIAAPQAYKADFVPRKKFLS